MPAPGVRLTWERLPGPEGQGRGVWIQNGRPIVLAAHEEKLVVSSTTSPASDPNWEGHVLCPAPGYDPLLNLWTANGRPALHLRERVDGMWSSTLFLARVAQPNETLDWSALRAPEAAALTAFAPDLDLALGSFGVVSRVTLLSDSFALAPIATLPGVGHAGPVQLGDLVYFTASREVEGLALVEAPVGDGTMDLRVRPLEFPLFAMNLHFSSLLCVDGDHPVVVYMRAVSRRTQEIWVARALVSSPEGPSDWHVVKLDQAVANGPASGPTFTLNQLLVVEGRLVLVYHNGTIAGRCIAIADAAW